MKTLTQPFWLLPNLLSLDAPAIALLWQAFLANAFHVPISLGARVSLGCAVWAIYIADRLLDTRNADALNATTLQRATPRHRFHRQHRKAMLSLFTGSLVCAAVVSALQVRPAVFQAGVLVAAAVLLYLCMVYAGAVAAPKQLLAAILFAAGTALAPIAVAPDKIPVVIGSVALFYACLANTSIIEIFEWRRTGATSSHSRPHPFVLGIAEHFRLFSIVGLAAVFTIFLTWDRNDLQSVMAAVALSVSSMLALHLAQHRVSPEPFRVLADVTLLSPLPVWLLWRL